ncbi:ATR-interacting protein [Hyperolius riggenbachi]|uniref:ATR-interacting protein n=1 Tax=Hyperolius riggenbachi TaxID=752182 RepID=UPI0035A3506C
MSVNPLFAARKRDISVLYGPSRAYNTSCPTTAQPVYPLSNDQSYPPSKRHRPADHSENKAMDDIFGDQEDFTADDLEEIDVLASQALTQELSSVSHPHRGNAISNKQSASASWQPRNSVPERPERAALKSSNGNDTFGLNHLQSEHEGLNQKLKSIQDEVLVKNGEIKVLRDALRQTESNLEQQRIAHVQTETEKARLQSEKEKELLRKIQSLQSELQFKDAEMNELKTKLQSAGRRSVAPQVSPKKSPSRAMKVEPCSSPQPGRSNFPTKESFNANTGVKSPLCPQLPTSLPEAEGLHEAVNKSRVFSSLCSVQRMSSKGSVLVNSLLQQTGSVSSLSLCHLLSNDLEYLPGSPVRIGHASNSSGKSASSLLSSAQCLALKNAQKLAITGLNSVALGEDLLEQKTSVQSRRGLPHLIGMSRLPGAVLILPLVEFHVTAYCQAIQPLEKSGVSPSDNQSLSSSGSSRTILSSVEETISGLGEPALASLGILYYLVFYSLEAVETLLQDNSEKWTHTAFHPETEPNPSTSRCGVLDGNKHLHPLFKNLVSLLSSTFVTSKRDVVREQVLRVLVKLAENAPSNLLIRFQCVLSSPVLLQCLSSDCPLPVALNAVRLLALLADQPGLAALFCSCSESCVLLALYTYVISRPHKHLSHSLWLQFEHEVVRLLNKLNTQGWSSPSSESGVSCQCNREVVKALVLTLHREWLCVRRLPSLSPTPAQNKSVQLLRESVILLYSFYQKDKNFNEHCLEVFHQYDQVVPGVRALLRKYNILQETEEFALDELCPPDMEAEDENMDCT